VGGSGYSSIHPAIDIAGDTGHGIFASDSGVVVFAGWNNGGYGNVIVVDHGNGWQTLYATQPGECRLRASRILATSSASWCVPATAAGTICTLR
jgi:hypothetical protein